MTRLPDHVETDRLVLRRWTVDDAPALAAAVTASLDHLRPWMPWAAFEPVDLDARTAWIDEGNRTWADGGDMVLGILLLDGTIVGGTGLHHRAGPDTLEIGYWVHVDHVGNGYATEASRALTTLAFTVDGIERVELLHDRANQRSRRVPEKLGYRFVGERAPKDAAPGEDGVHHVWEMRRADWRG